MKITEKVIRDRLKTVMDPELNINIVDLGLVYDIQLKTAKKKIKILMTLTTPGCPLAGLFDGLVRKSLEGLKGIDIRDDVEVELTFDPPWLPDLMSEAAKAELGYL